jgi:hypothetical protein
MADSNELKEESVRIDRLPESVSAPPGPDTKSRETVRIQLGLRESSDKLPPRVPTERSPAEVLTSPEVFPPSPAAQGPLPVAALPDAPSSSPKNETARIARMPDPLSKPLPTVQMKKTQPLIAMPHAPTQRASIAVAPAQKSGMPLCWVLLGVSAIILIIQIWTYLS